MKQYLACLLTAAMLLALTACGSTAPAASSVPAEAPASSSAPAEEPVGMANPNLYDIPAEEALEYTGISLNAPDGAENVSCNVIGYESESPMAETTFTLDGKDYTLRAQTTSLFKLYEEPAPDADSETITGILTDLDLTAVDISGIYEEWTGMGIANVSYCQAIALNSENASVLCWLDAVPGILYNLSVNEALDVDGQSAFFALAERCFTPAQGDVDGDVSEEEAPDAANDAEPAEGTYANGSYDSVTLTAAGMHCFDVQVELYRLASLEGEGRYEDGVLNLNLTDMNDGTIAAVFAPAEDGTWTLTITESSWEPLGTGPCAEELVLQE